MVRWDNRSRAPPITPLVGAAGPAKWITIEERSVEPKTPPGGRHARGAAHPRFVVHEDGGVRVAQDPPNELTDLGPGAGAHGEGAVERGVMLADQDPELRDRVDVARLRAPDPAGKRAVQRLPTPERGPISPERIMASISSGERPWSSSRMT